MLMIFPARLDSSSTGSLPLTPEPAPFRMRGLFFYFFTEDSHVCLEYVGTIYENHRVLHRFCDTPRYPSRLLSSMR